MNTEYDYETLKGMFKECERHDSYNMAMKLLDIYGFNAEQEINDNYEHWAYYEVDDYYVVLSCNEHDIFVYIFEEFDDIVDHFDNWLEYVDGEFNKVELV